MKKLKFKYKIDTADGNVWLWNAENSDDKFCYANTVEEVKEILDGEAFNYKQKYLEFKKMSEDFSEQTVIK